MNFEGEMTVVGEKDSPVNSQIIYFNSHTSLTQGRA